MLDIKTLYRFDDESEKPLDSLVTNGGMCGIIRTLGCIGDSLSSGEFQSRDAEGKPGYHDIYDYSWGQYIAREAGLTAYNFSKGGMTAKVFIESFAKDKGFYDPDKLCQAYIIAMGVNDITRAIKGEIPFGEAEDLNIDCPEKSAPTSLGYYGRIITEIKRLQPKARIFLMTHPKSKADEERLAYRKKHTEALYKFAEMFDYTYVIDLDKYAPVYDDYFHEKFFLDGHMNAAGYQLTARMVMYYIDYIIRHNMEDFTQIGFVGTDFHNVGYKW